MKIVGVFIAIATVAASALLCPVAAEVMLIGNDEKVGWNDEGKPVFSPPG